MNKKFRKVILTSPHSCLESHGYLDEANVWYPSDAIVDHPCNLDEVTYGQLDPTKYRLVDFSEPFDKRMEWWDDDRWRNDCSDAGYLDLTHRIALESIAPGHNPDKLTVQQVGEGFRLLTPEEIEGPQRPDVQYWYLGSWHRVSFASRKHSKASTYRTNRPLGQYLPKKKTVPKTLDDLPRQPFWRRLGRDVRDQPAGTITNNFNTHYLPTYIARGDTYSESLDGPWLPFSKEVDCE